MAMENMAKKVTRKFLLNIASIIVFSGSPESKVPIKPPAVQPETKAKEESVEVSKTRGQGVFLYSSRTERLTGISLSLKSKTTGHMVKIVKKATKKTTQYWKNYKQDTKLKTKSYGPQRSKLQNKQAR